jgi:hypothetical protein
MRGKENAMLRRGTLLVVAVAMGLFASACGRPEKVVITKYFEAVNQKDSQTLSSFATVDLNLAHVDDWSLVGVAEENDAPAPLAELLEQQKQADAKVTATRRKIMDYNIQHTGEVDQVKELRRGSKPIPAKLEGVARIWEEFVKEDREVKRAAAEAKARVETEKRIMTLSLGRVEDDMTGTMHTSVLNLDLTLSGQVKPYQMTLRQYKVQNAAGYKPMSRWIVVALAPKQ